VLAALPGEAAAIVEALCLLGVVTTGELREIAARIGERVQWRGRNLPGGIERAAEILENLPADFVEEVIGRIEAGDPELGGMLRGGVFSFGDALGLPDPDLRVLLKRVSAGDLALALKGEPKERREAFLGRLPEAARARLAERLASLGPVPLGEVENARVRIERTARALIAEGTVIPSGG
jgi:flagellar motor switch protein FliG